MPQDVPGERSGVRCNDGEEENNKVESKHDVHSLECESCFFEHSVQDVFLGTAF